MLKYSKQKYISGWMENFINSTIRGEELQDLLLEIIPPEYFLSRESLGGASDPSMYRDARYLIFHLYATIGRRRGLQVKPALEIFYRDTLVVKDAIDLACEMFEQVI